MDKSRQASRARERRLRAKYRRNIRVAIVLCLIIGLAGGFVAGRFSAGAPLNPFEKTVKVEPQATPVLTSTPDPLVTEAPTATPEVTEVPAVITAAPEATATPEVTAEPTSEAVTTTVQLPTAEPTATPTPAPQKQEIVVPYGESQKISVQAYSDGTARKVADALPFETLNFTMSVTRYLSNEYYNDTYGSTHRLVGNEAGVEFELLLNDYMGSMTIDPNELLKNTGVEDADGNIMLGYRFTDKEISGEDRFTMTTNVPMMMYKRFDNTGAEMKYLTVTTYIDGVENIYRFELGAPVVEPTPVPVVYNELTIGSKGEDVQKLQERLIELGYLTGTADGAYGSMTANAVKAAQKALSMTEDGIASPAFQQSLFAAAN